MSLETTCNNCGAEFDMRRGQCPGCGWGRWRALDSMDKQRLKQIQDVFRDRDPDQHVGWLFTRLHDVALTAERLQLGHDADCPAPLNGNCLCLDQLRRALKGFARAADTEKKEAETWRSEAKRLRAGIAEVFALELQDSSLKDATKILRQLVDEGPRP